MCSLPAFLVAVFELSEGDYRADEFELSMPVIVSKELSIILANPITIRLTPMTVDQALQEDIITEDMIGEYNEISPKRAGIRRTI